MYIIQEIIDITSLYRVLVKIILSTIQICLPKNLPLQVSSAVDPNDRKAVRTAMFVNKSSDVIIEFV